MKKEILKGKKFMATLTSDEMKWVSEAMVTNEVNKIMVDKILNLKAGEYIEQEEMDLLKELARQKFAKNGNKRLLEILKDEFKDVEIKIGINVAGKQKNLALMTDKIVSIFQLIFSNPQGFQQLMQMDGMSSAFNDILEFSGISGVDFSNLSQLPQNPIQMPQLQTNA